MFFSFFCSTVDCVLVSMILGEDVIFIANDWHSALVPCYLKANYKSKGLFKNAKVYSR